MFFDNMDDPRKQALLTMGLGLLSGRGGKGFGGFMRDVGGAGLLGMNAYGQAQAMNDRRSQEAQERELRAMQMAQMKQAQEDQSFARQIAPNFFAPGVQPNTPFDDEGNPMPSYPAKADFAGYGQALAARNPQMGAQFMAMAPKAPAPMKLGEGDRLIDPNTFKTLADNPKTKDWQDPAYQDFMMKKAAAGRSQVTTNVMPPREVFKDSLGLKKDFDGQPEVKGFKEVQGAWDQISTALKKPSPANDMAAATKFMKLLDPGSVVRESELMMAMQASGAWDRFTNTAERVIKGHKLTPQQREDFYKSGEALYQASLDRYGQTVQQYNGIAKQYGLDAQFIQNAKPRKQNNGWSIQRAD